MCADLYAYMFEWMSMYYTYGFLFNKYYVCVNIYICECGIMRLHTYANMYIEKKFHMSIYPFKYTHMHSNPYIYTRKNTMTFTFDINVHESMRMVILRYFI